MQQFSRISKTNLLFVSSVVHKALHAIYWFIYFDVLGHVLANKIAANLRHLAVHAHVQGITGLEIFVDAYARAELHWL